MIPALTPLTVALEAAKAAGKLAADALVRIVPKRWRSAREMRDAAAVAKSATVETANPKSGRN